MKAAFIFDTVIAQKESDYFGMTLNYNFFKERYLTMYDSVIVATRVKKFSNVKGAEGYKKLNGRNVEFYPIKSYKEIPDAIKNRGKIINELKEVIDSVDVVIIRMPSILGNIASEICRKTNKKYIIEMVACAWDGYINHRNVFGKVVAPIIFLNTRACVRKASNVLYVTNKFLQRRYPTKSNQIGCSDVVLNEVDKSVLENRLKKIKNMNIKKLNFCTVANVGMKYKGHIYMFNAIKKLKKFGYEIKYYLIGNGDRSYLKFKAEKLGVNDNIVFMGSLSHDNVFKELIKMDIYVQPSLQEGLPRALIEAMSIGMPAIGSNAGGIPELLNEEYVFKKKNVDELVRIILKCSTDDLSAEAKRNFEVSKKYQKEYLEEKRKKFYNI